MSSFYFHLIFSLTATANPHQTEPSHCGFYVFLKEKLFILQGLKKLTGNIWFIPLYPYLTESLCVFSHSVVTDSATPWTIVSLPGSSWEFSRQEYQSGFRCPPPGDLPNPQMEPRSPALQADSLPFEPARKPRKRSKSKNKNAIVAFKIQDLLSPRLVDHTFLSFPCY